MRTQLHSPLSSFIPSISRLAHSKDPSQLYLSILPLLRGCNDINTRFRHLLSSLLPTLCRHASARHSHASVARVARDCTESHKDGIKLHEQLNKDEVGVITLALLDGPAAAVRREAERGQEHKSLVAQGPPHQNSTADQAIDIDEETERATMGLGKSAPVAPSKDTTKDLPGRLGRKWLDAIERRE